MARLKGRQNRKYKRSCNQYYGRLRKAKKRGILKPTRSWIEKVVKSIVG